MENNLTYFQRRATQEHAAALCASDPCARRVHAYMALQYERLIRRLFETPAGEGGPPAPRLAYGAVGEVEPRSAELVATLP